MRNKWFFGAFILILSILCISIEKTPVHNQEITIYFSNNQKTSNTIIEAIASLKKQLSHLGVTHFKVRQLDNSFRITYHSDIAVSQIEKALSTQKGSTQSQDNNIPQTPSAIKSYEIAIASIQHHSDFDGISGTIVDYKFETTRATDIQIYSAVIPYIYVSKRLPTISQKITSVHLGLFSKNTSYNIPLVRAGPLC